MGRTRYLGRCVGAALAATLWPAAGLACSFSSITFEPFDPAATHAVYDSIDPGNTTENVRFDLSVTVATVCPGGVVVGFEQPSSGGAPANIPRFEITDYPSGAETTYYSNADGAGPTFPLFSFGQVPAGETRSHDFYVSFVDAGVFPGSNGVVDVPLTLIARDQNDPSTRATESSSVPIEVVGDTFEASFSGAGASGVAHTMDLGTLSTTGATSGTVGLTVESTTNYTIAVASENGGTLEHVTASWSIPYTLKINGTEFASPGPTVFTAPVLYTAPVGGNETWDLDVTVEAADVAATRAGAYQDIVTIAIEQSL